tara:strand:- start:13834 stop:14007 length:174 start_codon:yes stop_codon:yes gene_type:complete
LKALTRTLPNTAKTNIAMPYWVVHDYLRAIALILLDWAWLKIKQATSADAAHELSSR